MKVARELVGADAMMIIETDQECDQIGLEKIRKIPSVLGVTLVKPL